VWEVATGQELVRLTHEGAVRSAAFSPDGTRVLSEAVDDTVRVWKALWGTEICPPRYGRETGSVAFSPDGAVLLMTSGSIVSLGDVTWTTKLHEDSFVRAVVRTRVVGEGRLTEEEIRILRPILAEVDSDVVTRWLAPSPHDAEIEAILAQWRHHRGMALAISRKDWAAHASLIADPAPRTSRSSAALSNTNPE